MREDLLNEAESELAILRARNEREEFRRREQIAREQPEIYALVQEREALIFDTLRKFLKGQAESKDLPKKMDMLSAAIRDKLQKKGFPADYLAPVYRCPICQDTGRVGDPVREPCVCLKKAYQQKLREKIGLGNQQPETFERFDLSIFPNEKAPDFQPAGPDDRYPGRLQGLGGFLPETAVQGHPAFRQIRTGQDVPPARDGGKAD